jgi:hypothetical protein
VLACAVTDHQELDSRYAASADLRHQRLRHHRRDGQ